MSPTYTCSCDDPYLNFRRDVSDHSPQKNLEQIRRTLPSRFPCLMAVGGNESDEFQRQGEEFHKVQYDIIKHASKPFLSRV